MKIGIFYASAGGVTAKVAEKLAEEFELDEENVIFMEDDFDGIEQLDDYDVLLIGSSTWGQGDPHHEWVDPLMEIADESDFGGKTVAFFGAGDSVKHGEHFCSALGKMHDTFVSKGAKVVGFVDASEYSYEASLAERNGKFVGLAIDDLNEGDKTDERIQNWIDQLKSELGV